MTKIDLPLLRQSERGDFKQCMWKWDKRWNDGLVPAMPKLDALWFGTLWHLLWATVYTPPEGKDGFTRAITEPSEIHALWDELTKNAYSTVSGQPYWGDDQELEWNDAKTLGHIMIDGQLKEWNLDPGWEVLCPEQRFGANVPYNAYQNENLVKLSNDFAYAVSSYFPQGKHIARIVGTYDVPIRDHSEPGTPKIKIVDWKTISKRQSLKQLNKDDQTGTYLITARAALFGLGLIRADEPCEYMIFSFARKAKPPEETKLVDEYGRIRNKPQKNHYVLAINTATGVESVTTKDTIKTLETIAQEMKLTVFGEVSKNQGSPLFWREVVRRNKANRANQMRRMADEAEMIALARGGLIPILKSPGDHCNWCPYTDLCDIDEDGGDTETFIKDVFKYEDPYGDHRAGADNSKRSILDRRN